MLNQLVTAATLALCVQQVQSHGENQTNKRKQVQKRTPANRERDGGAVLLWLKFGKKGLVFGTRMFSITLIDIVFWSVCD
jgi:hypothetical protein